MTAQTSYSIYHAAGYEGGLDSDDKRIRTARNNTATPIPQGRFVVFDTGAGTSELAAALPSATGQSILGVVTLDQARETVAVGYAQNELMSVIYEGKVLVRTEQAVTPNDPVFVRFNAAGGTGTNPAVGQVRKDADTAKADAATNCRFFSSAAAGDLVWVLLNLP